MDVLPRTASLPTVGGDPRARDDELGQMVPLPLLLVVDDDAALRESLADVLRDERYVVATAKDGAEALALLRHGLRPHLVLLDIWMPGIDGVATLEAMRADPEVNDIPVVVITAAAEDVDAMITAKTALVMKKPLNMNLLIDAIERFRQR